jgi:hypothetical protein
MEQITSKLMKLLLAYSILPSRAPWVIFEGTGYRILIDVELETK